MKRVLIESPYVTNPDGTRADAQTVERNAAYLRACMRDCLERGEAPFASHGLYTLPGVLDDGDPDQRKLGMSAGWAWLNVADLVAVYVDFGITRGMRLGVGLAIDGSKSIEHRRLPPLRLQSLTIGRAL